jgi:hypothetical protein
MHLAELLSRRAVPGAGVTMELTRRCPLHCAHCSTSSTMSSPSGADAPFLRLVQTFREHEPPDVLVLSGGEPLLRPGLVKQLADLAHASGVHVSLISGMYFAGGNPPAPIHEALQSVDLVTASVDRFHDAEVPRRRVLAILGDLVEQGINVSLQVTVDGPDDPYLTSLLEDPHLPLNTPLFVSRVAAVGRGRAVVASGPDGGFAGPSQSAPAAWPVVTWDGRIVACSEPVVDEPTPEHLLLGDASVDAWGDALRRLRTSALLRSIHTNGSLGTAGRAGRPCRGYCPTCTGLHGVTPEIPAVMERIAVDTQVESCAVAYAARFGVPEHAWLVERGFAAVAA